MREVQANRTKARLAELLRRVEQGEPVAIIRHGKAIAHLVPAHVQERIERQQAVERFRQHRTEWKDAKMSTNEILAARHEGHRL